MAGFNATELADRLQEEQQQDYWLHLEAGTPLEKYPAKQHARRVVEKLGVSNGLIFLPGALARNNEDSDMPAPFRQRRYFYYISGCNEPNCEVIYDIQNDNLTLFIPRIDPARVIWNGRGSTPAEALNNYDIDRVFYVDQRKEFIVKWLNHYKGDLYILHPSHSPLASGRREVDSESLGPAMDLCRVIKDEHEIKLIRKANDISSQAHKAVLANILRFKNEAQVEGLFLDVCISKQAKQQAYDPIAASGPNAGTLHYDSNNEDFEDRQLMCLDAGCEWQLYASDITRTFPLSGDWPSEEARNIYRLVERMQETCISGLAPGVRFFDLHILAHHIAIDGLLTLGILHNGTREEIFKAGTSRAFFPHGLGHHVGLEVHDVGHAELISVSGEDSKHRKASSVYPENFHVPVYDAALCMAPVHPQSGHLEEDMVVTVEPGIYFSTYALNMFYLPSPVHSKYINVSVLKKYLPVGGVRIEDDILITSNGYENLTTAPKGDAMLEIIRSQNHKRSKHLHSEAFKTASDNTANGKAPVEKQKEQLVRAPGVPKHMPDPIPRALERAATLPVRSAQRQSVDLEPFDGPSLFSNFKRASTTDVAGPVVETGPSVPSLNDPYASTVTSKPAPRTPICGDDSSAFNHRYLEPTSPVTSPKSGSGFNMSKLVCPQCDCIVQSMPSLAKALRETQSQHSLSGIRKSQSMRTIPPASAEMRNTYASPTITSVPTKPGVDDLWHVTPEAIEAARVLFPNPSGGLPATDDQLRELIVRKRLQLRQAHLEAQRAQVGPYSVIPPPKTNRVSPQSNEVFAKSRPVTRLARLLNPVVGSKAESNARNATGMATGARSSSNHKHELLRDVPDRLASGSHPINSFVSNSQKHTHGDSSHSGNEPLTYRPKPVSPAVFDTSRQFVTNSNRGAVRHQPSLPIMVAQPQTNPTWIPRGEPAPCSSWEVHNNMPGTGSYADPHHYPWKEDANRW